MTEPTDSKMPWGWIVCAFALGFVTGAGIIATNHQDNEQKMFERGRAQGLVDCQKPSRMEKAAKWLAE